MDSYRKDHQCHLRRNPFGRHFLCMDSYHLKQNLKMLIYTMYFYSLCPRGKPVLYVLFKT